MNIHSELKSNFNLDSFRLGQQEIIESVLNHKDVLAIMPTGGGKSLCYQLPAYSKPGLTIVISPLIALMNDQVRHLKDLNLPTGCMHSGLSLDERKAIFAELNDALEDKKSFVLFLTPERVQKEGFAKWIVRQNVNYFAIDEAHCVSKWGHDFRQEYSQLSILKQLKPNVPIIALTATATPIVKNDIKKYLSMNEPAEHVYGFYRSNLYYQVEFCENEDVKKSYLLGALTANKNGRILIYCGTRKKTESWHEYLSTKYGKVGFYHAGLNKKDREAVEAQFASGDIRILTATNAFGMGIDLPDVRLVVHTQIPGNIESYYQEVGRAGRDGLPATCLMLYSKKDKGLQSFFITQSDAPKDIINKRWRALDAMVNFAEGSECRHSEILVYFNDQNRIKSCGHCDTCDTESKLNVKPEFIAEAEVPKKKKKSKYDKLFQTEIPADKQWMIKDLKKWRKEYAQENSVPAFMIFSDKSLRDLINQLPTTEHDLINVYGFGESKVESLSSDLLPVMEELKNNYDKGLNS